MSFLGSSAAWVFGSTVLAGLILRHWLGDHLFLTRYTGYMMPWLLLGVLPGAVWAWLIHSRALSTIHSVSAAIILVAHVSLFRSHQAISPLGVELDVMSYNTWSANTDARRIANVVLDHAPDILLLQEIRPEVFGRLMESLRDLYDGRPVYCAYEPAIQQAVISRYRVDSSAGMAGKGKAQRVVLRLPDGPITVFNVHPLRSGGWRQRYRQIASLLEENVLRETTPVILGGDLNAPDHSQLYALVAGHLKNAHREAGFGFGFTYPSSEVRVLGLVPAPSLVRIDHVFFSDHFVALRAGTMDKSGGSDHRPVFADLDLRWGTPDDGGRRSSLGSINSSATDPGYCPGHDAAGDRSRHGFAW